MAKQSWDKSNCIKEICSNSFMRKTEPQPFSLIVPYDSKSKRVFQLFISEPDHPLATGSGRTGSPTGLQKTHDLLHIAFITQLVVGDCYTGCSVNNGTFWTSLSGEHWSLLTPISGLRFTRTCETAAGKCRTRPGQGCFQNGLLTH